MGIISVGVREGRWEGTEKQGVTDGTPTFRGWAGEVHRH